MKPINCTHLGACSQALFMPKRQTFLGDPEKKDQPAPIPAEEQAKIDSAEAAKKKPPGIPIDQPAKSAEEIEKQKQRIMEAAKKAISEAEKKVIDKFGGTILEMNKIPGNENKDYQNQVYVNAPKNPEKIVDKDGKPVPPRVVYYFHGNGSKIGDSAEAIMAQVEQMRANGDNVILVMPQDNKGNWKEMEHPEAFKDMQKTVEALMGGKPIKDISISSFSGGSAGVEKVLKNLRENADKDPEAKKLYKNIRQLGFMDDTDGNANEFAQWAADKNHTIFSNYTAKCESGNKMLENAIRDARGGDMEGITITSFNGIHGNAPSAFIDAMKGRASTVGEDVENVSVTENGPRIPERSPDAMTPEQFERALSACKNEEEKKLLYIDQAHKGNVPDHYRKFQNVKVDKKNFTVEFSVAPHGFAIGTNDRFVEIAPDGYTAAALVAGYNCSLPTKWLVEQKEKQPNAQRVHFSHQGEFAQELTDEHGNPLDPRITHGARTWSADFILKHNEKTREWAQKHEVNWGGLVVGYYKDIVQPEPGITGRDRLEIFGGIFDDGRRVQPLSGGKHETSFHDYSGNFGAVSNIIKKNGIEMTAKQARNDPELMADPEIAKQIKGMIGELPTYDYSKDTVLNQYVEQMRKGLPAARLVSTVSSPAANAAPSERAVPSSAAPKQSIVPVGPEIGYRPSQGIPIGGGDYGGGGGRAPAQSPGPSAQHESYTEPTPAPQRSTPEPTREHVETAVSNKVFIIGDSLSTGFAGFIKGPNVTHVQTKTETSSYGAHTVEMLTAFTNKVLPQNVEGATLVIVGGTNDIFGPDSLEVIKKNLNKIYTLAKGKGMKVVGATLPPVGHSRYAKDNWESTQKNPAYKDRFSSYEEYNEDLIKRWKDLNSWIMGRKGIKDDIGKGPDEVVEFHQVLENPDLPGSLSKDNYGEGGIHLKDYSLMGNRLLEAVTGLNPAEPKEEQKQTEGSDQPGKSASPAIENTRGFNITSETAFNIKPVTDPTKDQALGQNSEIRKQLEGYSGLNETVTGLSGFANQLLASREFGAIVYFSDGTNDYVAIKEWHPPYDRRHPSKPQKWHHGISVMKKSV
jgi:hypothetical protein